MVVLWMDLMEVFLGLDRWSRGFGGMDGGDGGCWVGREWGWGWGGGDEIIGQMWLMEEEGKLGRCYAMRTRCLD
jgi:hypothetical protein